MVVRRARVCPERSYFAALGRRRRSTLESGLRLEATPARGLQRTCVRSPRGAQVRGLGDWEVEGVDVARAVGDAVPEET